MASDDFTRSLVYDEIIYEEAEKLQDKFYQLHLVRTPLNGAVYDTLDPLYTDYLRNDEKSRLVRAFTSGFKSGFEVGLGEAVASTYLDSKYYVQTGRDPWSKNAFTRGQIIDDALGNNLGRTFPTVDRLENRVVTSIKSLDTGAKTYQSRSGLFSKLSCYINELNAYQGSANYYGGTRVLPSDFDSKALEIAIPNRVLTQEQMQGIIQAIEKAAKMGIELKIRVVD